MRVLITGPLRIFPIGLDEFFHFHPDGEITVCHPAYQKKKSPDPRVRVSAQMNLLRHPVQDLYIQVELNILWQPDDGPVDLRYFINES